MKKRILGLVLVAIMCLSSANIALAAKVQNDVDLCESFGSFDSADIVQELNEQSHPTVTFETKLQKSGEGCIKVDTPGYLQSVRIPAPLAIGETYTVSVDLMSSTGTSDLNIRVLYQDDNSYYDVAPAGTKWSQSWKNYTYTWTHTDDTNLGKRQENTNAVFVFYYAKGSGRSIQYIDNFSLVAHGNVPDADYSALVYKNGTLGNEDRIYTLPDNEITEVTFSDVNGHWSQEAVETLATYNYINGMGEGLYSPESNLTRAQFVKMAVDYLSIIPHKYDGSMKDISGNEWFADYITTAVNIGIIDEAMTFGGFFYPDKAITREEAATIAAKTAAIRVAEKPGSKASFKDEGKISSWAKDGVKDAVAYGLINGYADGTYRPANHITRAEAAQILFRICELTTRFNIYVDPKNGNDKNAGTKEAPLLTVHAARDMARIYNDDMKNNINIRIKGKVVLEDTLTLNNEDSGSNGFNIIYTSWGDEKATLSMGADYTGFELYDKEKNIYRVQIGKGAVAAQAYFNGKRGILARTITGMAPDGEAVVSDDGTYFKHFISSDRWLLDLKYPKDLRIRFSLAWNDVWIALGSLEELEDGRVKLTPLEDSWVPGKKLTATNNIGYRVKQWGREHTMLPFYFENAYEFLDHDGEWYLNSHDGYMYYIPREGEDMSTMVVTIGEGQTIVDAQGDSAFNPVHHIQFKNLKFTETNWLGPIEWGGVNCQQNNVAYFPGNSRQGHYPGALHFYNAWYIGIYDSEFSNLGAAGLYMEDRIKHIEVTGNEFKDLAAGAMVLGSVGTDTEGTPKRETILYNECYKVTNNYIHDISADYKGGAGLTLGYVRNVEVANNFITNTPYSGMHIGWGWDARAKHGTICENIRIHHNRVQEVQVDHIYDGGCIYSVGAERLPFTETKSYVYNNYMKTNRNAGPGLYHDQGSSGWYNYNNIHDQSAVQFVESTFNNQYYWTPERLGYLEWSNANSGGGNSVDDFYTTVIGGAKNITNPHPSNRVGEIHYHPNADWPQEALDIMAAAGISEEYKDKFDTEGPIYFTSDRKLYYVHNGTTVDLELAVRDKEGNDYDLKDFNIVYNVSDPSVISVSDDLKVTALKEGQSDILVTAEVNGRTQIKHLRVLAVPELAAVKVWEDAINTFEGRYARIRTVSTDINGKNYTMSRKYTEFKSEDTSVAEVSKDGIVTAKARGTTTIKAKISYCGMEVEKDVKYTTISYVYDYSKDHPFRLAGSEILSPVSWNNAKAKLNGVSVEGMPQLTKNPIEPGLIAFDMVIKNPNSWPTITFGGKDPKGSYSTDDVYMVGFKKDHVEFQRFNKGVRSFIFGNQGGGVDTEPIAGPGRPNVGEDAFYQYNERVSVIIGAIDEEEGTRIVITINGEPVIDYVDTASNRIPAGGYFGVYNNGGGTFEFYPYTGITKDQGNAK